MPIYNDAEGCIKYIGLLLLCETWYQFPWKVLSTIYLLRLMIIDRKQFFEETANEICKFKDTWKI